MGLFDRKVLRHLRRKDRLTWKPQAGKRKSLQKLRQKALPVVLRPARQHRRGDPCAACYRAENQEKVAAFHTTRTLGADTKVLLDEDAGKFMVTRARNLAEANPDVLDFAT